MTQTINTLRSQLRKQRRALSVFEQKQAEQACFQKLIRSSIYQQAKHIGIYLDAFGEVQTRKIIQWSFQHNKQIFLPQVCNMSQKLTWVKITQHQYRNLRFHTHPLGMLEPYQTRGQHISKLDLVIMPLVACDYMGSRIGMGGGFYDRTLASASKKPFRLGLAHDFQLISATLARQKWDQPLDALLCPQKYVFFKR